MFHTLHLKTTLTIKTHGKSPEIFTKQYSFGNWKALKGKVLFSGLHR
jgi:hypothetical protein